MNEAGSGTVVGWTVEARYVCDGAKIINGQVFDHKWRRVNFEKSSVGVPRGAIYQEPWLTLTNQYGYEAAQSLRWWFYTARERSGMIGTLCLETRLARHKISYSYNVEREGADHVANEENCRYVNNQELSVPAPSPDPGEPDKEE